MMPTIRFRRGLARWMAGALLVTAAAPAAAQWATTHEQYYLPGDFNWQFRALYPSADRLFNAFDYGHAILYEIMWSRPASEAVPALEQREFERITRELLVNPPRLPLEEAAIAPRYSRLAPEAKVMFEWAHVLHRQLYDVLADERLSPVQRDAKVTELLAYYRSRKDLAFSSKPKSMNLMEGQPYSLAFRKAYPKFNGLIWAYHWLQVGLYDALLAGATPAARRANVDAAVARFRQMLVAVPQSTPYIMPMTAAVAPEFSRRYPEAAIIFDNLHSMHDVISDILANDVVPRDRKRAEIVRAANRYRDDTTEVTTIDEWTAMAIDMGIENQGGPVLGALTVLPTPTVELGAVMRHEEHGAPGAAAREAEAHAGHEMPAAPTARRDTLRAPATPEGRAGEQMASALMVLLDDATARARIVANSALRQAILDLLPLLPEDHRAHLEFLLRLPPVPPPQEGRGDSRESGSPAGRTGAAIEVQGGSGIPVRLRP